MQAPPIQDGRAQPCQERSLCECGCAELEERLATRDQFIGALGHELRNAVSPLAMLADHFEQLAPSSEPQLARRVGMLTRNLNKLMAVIDRLTEVSALRDGKLDLEYGLVDLRDVVDDVARELADDAARAHANLRVYYTSAVQGWWDRARLKQILGNLVTNAIRYGDGAAIEIRTQLRGSDAELVIEDQGPGVPVELREHLFDRFDHRTKTCGSRFGVGLFVVQALCHAMGGTVRLEATATGARFCVTLPRG